MHSSQNSAVKAVLGPTNTGKTHLAIERLCGHSSGIMGFPLRLLAREVYDRVVAIKGRDQVALITGEERIAPAQACYFLCTAESMPRDADVAFVALDEAQLGSDFERGHVFTDRLLSVRGREETMILGSATLKPALSELVPEAEIVSRPRFSSLAYAGAKKLSRLPPRSAIVAFSAEEVYAVAEMIRRQRGGAAVVMGALSPRTRNAQVAMFQAGEVDYLVATDAIGMGLNLDVSHVAFASLTKFDGQRLRRLYVTEMAQIAGRAGRHQRDGTFGVVGQEDGPNAFLPEEIERIEQHRFEPFGQLYWRNGDPDCSSVEALIASLEEKPDHPRLRAATEAVDLSIVRRLASEEGVAATLSSADMVARFWAACGQPDFRKLGADHHARFVERIWRHLSTGSGCIPVPVFADALARLENVEGDIEKLSGRIAEIRSWAYIAHRANWLDDPAHWAGRTAEVEARLSDALHEKLTQRFVDRRTTTLMRDAGLDSRSLPVEVCEDGVVSVDDEAIGHLKGFRFLPDGDARLADKKMLIAAAERHLGTELTRRAEQLITDSDSKFAVQWNERRGWGLDWRGDRVATLDPGKRWFSPTVRLDPAIGNLSPDMVKCVEARLAAWLIAQADRFLTPLIRLEQLAKDGVTPAPLRALYSTLIEKGGSIPRRGNEGIIDAVPPAIRRDMRRAGVVPGHVDLFMPRLMKPRPLQWIATLRAIHLGEAGPLAEWPGPWSSSKHPAFRSLGARALRVDLAERLLWELHAGRKGRKIFTPNRMFMTSLGMAESEWGQLLRDAGFRRQGDGWVWRGMAGRRRPENKLKAKSGSGHFDGLEALVSHG